MKYNSHSSFLSESRQKVAGIFTLHEEKKSHFSDSRYIDSITLILAFFPTGLSRVQSEKQRDTKTREYYLLIRRLWDGLSVDGLWQRGL